MTPFSAGGYMFFQHLGMAAGILCVCYCVLETPNVIFLKNCDIFFIVCNRKVRKSLWKYSCGRRALRWGERPKDFICKRTWDQWVCLCQVCKQGGWLGKLCTLRVFLLAPYCRLPLCGRRAASAATLSLAVGQRLDAHWGQSRRKGDTVGVVPPIPLLPTKARGAGELALGNSSSHSLRKQICKKVKSQGAGCLYCRLGGEKVAADLGSACLRSYRKSRTRRCSRPKSGICDRTTCACRRNPRRPRPSCADSQSGFSTPLTRSLSRSTPLPGTSGKCLESLRSHKCVVCKCAFCQS